MASLCATIYKRVICECTLFEGNVRVENSSAIEITVVAFGSGQVPGKSIGVVV